MILNLLCLLALVVVIGFLINKEANRLLHNDDDLEEAPYIVDGEETTQVPDDAFVFVTYRDFVFPMRINEKRDIWDTMNRQQKNDQLEANKKAVKQGKVSVVYGPDGEWLFVPKSANLKKVQQDYATFKNAGKKIEE